MMEPPVFRRRGLLATGAGLAVGGMPLAAAAQSSGERAAQAMRSAAQYGAVGDGSADDTAALQRALDETLAEGGVLAIPPGTYKVTRPLRVTFERNVGRNCGIIAHGARLLSRIDDGGNVLSLVSKATVRFVFVEGLDILGSGREGHGIVLDCDRNGSYLYNFCLKDVVVQDVGGDGCAMVGNVFEGQVINSYFRDNKGNGASFAHGPHGGILSAVHVFGCVFGQNGKSGAALLNNCYDVAFHGCYFLLNGEFGLIAHNGCTLLDNCGFENNHMAAKDFARGDTGMYLAGFATLVGCGAYSIYYQTGLIRAYVVGHLVMIGCTGFGDRSAKEAGMAKLSGRAGANATIIGSKGTVEYLDGFEGLEIGGDGGGIRFGADWKSRNLPQLGDYRLWVDRGGRLRMKKGAPSSDEDGSLVGA